MTGLSEKETFELMNEIKKSMDSLQVLLKEPMEKQIRFLREISFDEILLLFCMVKKGFECSEGNLTEIFESVLDAVDE